MDGISLSTATGAIVDDLAAEYGIGKKRARILLANCLLRTMVQTDIYNMADHIMQQEEKRKEAKEWQGRPR